MFWDQQVCNKCYKGLLSGVRGSGLAVGQMQEVRLTLLRFPPSSSFLLLSLLILVLFFFSLLPYPPTFSLRKWECI